MMVPSTLLERRALDLNVRLMGATTSPRKTEGSAVHTGGSESTKHAVMEDAPTLPEKEESALDMEQRIEFAAMKDASTNPSKEVSAFGMEQSRKDAVMKDVPTKPSKEECAFDTEQRAITKHAAMISAPTLSPMGESALGMEQR